MDTYGWQQIEALGDPTRRAIFAQLTRGPRSVGELAATFPISRPAVSQHLKVLKDAKLVLDQRNGTQRIYQVDPEAVAALRSAFDRFWGDALDAFEQAAERERPDDDGAGTDERGSRRRAG